MDCSVGRDRQGRTVMETDSVFTYSPPDRHVAGADFLE